MNKFKYLLPAIAIMICGCKNSNQENTSDKIGEYLYIDQYKCLHIKENCFELMFGEENEKPNYMINRIPTKELKRIGKTCSYCVTDKIYKELLRMTEKNVMDEENRILNE
jgi:hypothetical protein